MYFKLSQHCTPEVPRYIGARLFRCAYRAEQTSALRSFVQAQKKRGARLRRVGFPVYNLMKSFESVVNVCTASFCFAAVSFH
jgi:hypothetical protein